RPDRTGLAMAVADVEGIREGRAGLAWADVRVDEQVAQEPAARRVDHVVRADVPVPTRPFGLGDDPDAEHRLAQAREAVPGRLELQVRIERRRVGPDRGSLERVGVSPVPGLE